MALLSTKRISWLRHHQRLSHGVIALFWVVVFIVGFLVPSPIQSRLFEIDCRLADNLAVNGRLTPSNPDIVFLGIDDASTKLDALDPELIKKEPVLSMMAKEWPWNRDVHAAVLDRLTQAGARVVIFDILFPHPTSHDEALKEALDRSANKVVIGCNLIEQAGVMSMPCETIIPSTSPTDSRVALVNFWPDEDKVIRRTRFKQRYIGSSIGQIQSGEMLDSIGAKVLKILGKADLIPPLERNYWFRYTGEPGQSFKTFSLYRLFYPPDWENLFQNGAYFKNKIVMVGPRQNFQQDEHLTPFSYAMDGAEVHLQALNAALHGELLTYIGENPYWLSLLVSLAGFIAWLLGITMQRISLKRVVLSVFLACALGAAYFFSGLQLYSHGIILAFAAPFGALSFTLVSGLSGQYVLEQLERARTRRFLERYVSPKIVQQMLDNPRGYQESLSGRRRQVTVLFSDLRGFTSMTQDADSEQLVRELNEYLQEMTRALFENEGILDKFIGDAVMAVWGSFEPHPEQDARNAVSGALAMQEALVKLNAGRRERGLKDFAMGVGINHGEAIVGDIGSEQKSDFTVIGDSVNLASRLEGTTKQYGVGLLISETVEELVRPHFHMQTVDSIVVVGRTKPVMTYTVHGRKEVPLPDLKAAYLEKFEEAMRLYRAEKFQQAREGFAACGAMYPEDKLSHIFEERSAEFAVNPPPQPWDGSYTMTKK